MLGHISHFLWERCKSAAEKNGGISRVPASNCDVLGSMPNITPLSKARHCSLCHEYIPITMSCQMLAMAYHHVFHLMENWVLPSSHSNFHLCNYSRDCHFPLCLLLPCLYQLNTNSLEPSLQTRETSIFFQFRLWIKSIVILSFTWLHLSFPMAWFEATVLDSSVALIAHGSYLRQSSSSP